MGPFYSPHPGSGVLEVFPPKPSVARRRSGDRIAFGETGLPVSPNALNEKCAHFREGFKLFFGFQKGGWGVPARELALARNARTKGLVLSKLVCDALHRASPDPK